MIRMDVAMGVMACAVTGFLACGAGPAKQTHGGPMKTVELDTGAPALYRAIRPAGTAPVPAGYDEAERRFDQAVAHYEAGRWLEAAEGFVAAADATPRGGPHENTLAADRTAAYRNALSAWRMAGDLDAARAALAPRLEADPECRPHVDLP